MQDRFERFSYALFEIWRSWYRITGDEMSQYGLRGPHGMYMITIMRYPEGISAGGLCEVLGRDKAGVSRAMTLLEERGLVYKESMNRRNYAGVYKLTETGHTAAEHIRRRVDTAVRLAGQDVSDEDHEIFYSALERISAGLYKLSREGLPPEETE